MQYNHDNKMTFKSASPTKHIRLSLKMPTSEKQHRTSLLTVGGSSVSSSTSSDTRMSRLNNRPIYGSPMISARECSTRSRSSDTTAFGDDLEAKATVAAAMFTNSSNVSMETLTLPESCLSSSADTTTTAVSLNYSLKNTFVSEGENDESNDTINQANSIDENNDGIIDNVISTPSGLKRMQFTSIGDRIDSTRNLFQRRLDKIDSAFFKENPARKVPRFVPSELSLGDQLGEGEYGSVFEIEYMERQPPPTVSDQSFNFPTPETKSEPECMVDDECNQTLSHTSTSSSTHEPATASLTLPIAADLLIGKGDLEGFLRRRIEILDSGNKSKDIQPSLKLSHDDNISSDCENDRPVSDVHNNNAQHNGHDSDQLAKSSIHSEHRERVALRRPALNAKDSKGQMIRRQNHEDSFEGYAVKVVRGDIHSERKKRVAAADMAAEAKILSALNHSNIIRIRGIMGYIEKPGSYGIIMDKLRSTLQDQIHLWAKTITEDNIPNAAPEKHSFLEKIPTWLLLGETSKEKQTQLFKQTEFFLERMEAAMDVAKAMKYLHSKKIIFRDLKPENVGLTQENYVLFDFGLSRYLKDSDRVEDGHDDQYHATGLTGSRLFMAPEVARCKAYGFSADVFSFSILFWEVVSIKAVFPAMTMNKHFKQVIVRGKRPESMEHALPPELNEMMENSWDSDPLQRPTFASICEILEREIEKFKNDHQTSVHFPYVGSSSILPSERSDYSDELLIHRTSPTGGKSDKRISMLMKGHQSVSSRTSRKMKSSLFKHLNQFESTLEKVKESFDEKIPSTKRF